MTDLHSSVSRALGDDHEEYDIDAIVEALGNVTDIDDVPGDEFWEIVRQSQVPDSPDESPEDLFRAELTQALSEERPLGGQVVWRRGGVTMTITGASRVNHSWPQVTAEIDITSLTGEKKHLRGEYATWTRLWDTTSHLLDSWSSSVADRRAAYQVAQAAAERAKERARKAAASAARAEEALNSLLSTADHVSSTMAKHAVADYLDIAPGSVRKQMTRWGIDPTYERGPSGRTEARYPSAEVQAAASRRPGRGHRTDLE